MVPAAATGAGTVLIRDREERLVSKKRVMLSWSSGKDAAWTLHTLQHEPGIELVGLFCTVNKSFDRVAVHGVRIELLVLQAERVGLPLELIEIPYPCSNEIYEKAMSSFIEKAKTLDIDCFAFGDLFLDDIRNYREEQLTGTGITPIFPIWGIPTDELAKTMIRHGLKAVITCLDPKQMPRHFAGREYDESFLNDIPDNVDPCGENGEFHSYVFDGPIFDRPINISVGEVVDRDGFVFADVAEKFA